MAVNTSQGANFGTLLKPRAQRSSSRRFSVLAKSQRLEEPDTPADGKQWATSKKRNVMPYLSSSSTLDADQDEEQGFLQWSADNLGQAANSVGSAVQSLLYGAASRMQRGTTHCIKCKGTGLCECPKCKGKGVIDPSKVRMNQMRHSANKLRVMLGDKPGMYEGQWQLTNRCSRCHGLGQCACPACDGRGFRGGVNVASKDSTTSP